MSEQVLIFAFLMVVGTGALGLFSVGSKSLLLGGQDSNALLVAVTLVSGPVLLLVSLLVGIPTIKAGFLPAVAGTVLLNMVSQTLAFLALSRAPLSLTAPIRLLIPIFVLFTGYLFLREVPSAGGVLGIAVSMVGLLVLIYNKTSEGFDMKAVMFALVSAFLSALSFPLDKQAVVSSSALFATGTIVTLLGLGLALFHAVLTRSFLHSIVRILTSEPKRFLGTCAAWAFGVTLTNQALAFNLVSYASSFKRLEVFWSLLLSGVLLKEKGIGTKAVAASIMFVGMVMTVLVG